MSLSRLIYISENQINDGELSVLSQLSNLLSSSNRNNSLNGITGALVFDKMWFLQALEGDRRLVFSEYERIREDDRHSNVTLVDFRAINYRMFGNWWMGFAIRNEQTEHLFNPYTRNGRFFAERMSATEILGLMGDFAELGGHREVVRRVA